MEAPYWKLASTVFIIGTALLPFAFEPLRFEPYEAHRAALLALLALVALPPLRSGLRRIDPSARPLLIAIVVWCAALALSTAFALSPARALFGDSLRRMGLLTQLALAAVALLSVWVNPRAAWRWFWAAGVVAAAFQLLQASGWLSGVFDRRVGGVFGSSTFTGGWLALALLWAAVGSRGDGLRGWRRVVIYVGLALMVAALALTESRGAALGLAAGAMTAWLIWTATRRSIVGVVVVVAALVIGAGALNAINRANRRGQLEDVPLLSRITLSADDQTRTFREDVWANALLLARTWPMLTSLENQPDRWAGLRPLLGYGPDLFEIPHRTVTSTVLLLSVKGQRIDRAHNDWLDTLIMNGWGGLLARIALWGCAWQVGLRRLGLGGRWAWLAQAAGGVVGGFVARGTPLLPLGCTIGALAGGWLWLALQSLRRTPRGTADVRAWIALSVLSAYVVDLQFSFATVATGWPAWLALGLLLIPSREDEAITVIEPGQAAGWAAIAGALLVRSLVLMGIGAASIGALLVVVIAVWATLSPLRVGETVKIAAVLVLGWLAAQARSPELAALIDVAWLMGALALLYGAKPSIPRRGSLMQAVIVVAALAMVWTDISADMYLRRGQQSFTPGEAADALEYASALRLWDAQVAASAGTKALEAGQAAGINALRLAEARFYLERAAQLNPFDSEYALRLAILERTLAQVATDSDLHRARAARYFMSAARLSPGDPLIWGEWARFLWDEAGRRIGALGG
jgi:hypothetical protein